MSRRIHRAPLALASDGSLIVNVHHITGETNLAALVAQAAEHGGTIFIGVVADEHRALIAEMIDDVATEAASVVLAKM